MKFLRQFCECEDGATAIEYSLIAVFIGLAGVGALTLLGTELGSLFTAIQGILNAGTA